MLNTLDGNTTGAVNAATITAFSGTAATLNTAYASSGITGLGNEVVTLTDTTLAITALNNTNSNTTGAVANSVTTPQELLPKLIPCTIQVE